MLSLKRPADEPLDVHTRDHEQCSANPTLPTSDLALADAFGCTSNSAVAGNAYAADTACVGDSPDQSRVYADSDYFRSYEDISLHLDMIRDYPRTQTYRQAILKNYQHFYKKVVLDVGAGTGILSVFCAQAGASRVYAVEASGMAEYAQQVVKENGMEDKISVLKGKVEDLDLPEKVDVIVSEWMGYCLLHESMLKSVVFARDHFLKKEGYMYPSSATLYAAPVSDDQLHVEHANEWEEVESLYKVKMVCMKVAAQARGICNRVVVDQVNTESIVARAASVCSLDLLTVTAADLASPIKGNFTFNCFGRANISGLVAWFTVTFPNEIVLSTSPYSELTHWRQSLFYFEPVRVEQDTLLLGSMTLSYDKMSPRFLVVGVKIKSDSGEAREGRYKME